MSSADDRLFQAVREIIRAEDSRRTYGAIWEYAVTSSRRENGFTIFDGEPTAKPDEVEPFTLPPAVGWIIRPGIAGADFLPAPNSVVLVTFANRDPSRPRVVGYDSLAPSSLVFDSTGTMTIGASADEVLMARGAATVLRDGDFVALVGVVIGANPHLKLVLANIPIADPDPSKVKA